MLVYLLIPSSTADATRGVDEQLLQPKCSTPHDSATTDEPPDAGATPRAPTPHDGTNPRPTTHAWWVSSLNV